MLDAFAPFLHWELSQWEVYGLFFLLGSFAVATLSDLKHMSAQKEFMDVWWAFAIIILGIQLYAADFEPPAILLAKWALVLTLGTLSHRTIGLWLRLATADVAAIVAAASLFSPLLVLAFFLLLKILAIPAARLLARGRAAYPFMPVISAATLAIMLLALLTGMAAA